MVRARVGRIGRGRGGQTRGGRRNGRGRGVLSSNASNPPETSEDSKCPADFDNFDFVGSFDKAVISIFTKQSSFKQHFDAQNTNRERYLAILLVVRSKSVELHDGSKCKALAAAWARQDYQLAQTMLEIPGEEFALKEVLKAVSILDAGRQKRQQEKVLRRLEAQGCRKKGKMAKLKSVIASLAQDIPPVWCHCLVRFTFVYSLSFYKFHLIDLSANQERGPFYSFVIYMFILISGWLIKWCTHSSHQALV